MEKQCHVGIKGIICSEGRCLLLQKANGEDVYWDAPGGRINGDEKIEETLERELREELPSIGKFSIGEIAGAYRRGKDVRDGIGLVLIFYRVEAEPFEVTLSPEHAEYKWFSREDLAGLRTEEVSIAPELAGFIEKILLEGESN